MDTRRMTGGGIALAAVLAAAGVARGVTVGDQEIGVTFYTPRTVRIVKVPTGRALTKPFVTVTAQPGAVPVTVRDGSGETVWESAALRVRLDKAAREVAFEALDGTPLLKESGAATFTATNYNGVAAVRPAQAFAPDRDERLYGLGDLQNGRLSQRGVTRTLHPWNVGDGIAYVASEKGYAVWWDNTSPTTFADRPGEATRFESDTGDGVDYYFMWGGSGDGCVAEMRALTGDVPLFPRWAFGFWQSKERYKSSKETLSVLERYRKDGIPLDGIVQDWQYWGPNYLWNAMEFTGEAFRDGPEMVRKIHEQNAKVIITIWSSFGPMTKQYRELEAKGLLFPFRTWPESGLGHIWPPRKDYPSGVKLYDPYSPVARDIYWNNLRRLYDLGLDGWWMDSTDPDHMYREGDFEHPTSAGATFRAVRSAYPVATTGGVYDHQRATTDRKRVFILTRGAGAGQQRYATAVWSGDVASNWNVLRAQVPGGLNYTLTGNPNFNCDLGGFFASRYGHGMEGTRNPAWRELYVRWMQLGAFMPMMRSHGTQIPREIFLYGEKGEPVYDALVDAVRLRYRLMPYLYSLAGHVTKDRASFMRPVWFDFPDERDTCDKFLLGDAILATPILRALYTAEDNTKVGEMEGWNGSEKAGAKSEKLDFTAEKTVEIALPKGADWWMCDFNAESQSRRDANSDLSDSLANARDSSMTGALAPASDKSEFIKYKGGSTATVAATLRSQPFFVKAGSILPLGPDVQYNGEKAWDDLEVVVFPGADGAFDFYEDAFETYDYEKGAWSEIPFRWDDAARTLTIGARRGGYPEMPKTRTFRIRRADSAEVQTVVYSGDEVRVTLGADFHGWAKTPPMGWNSWDCYGAAVDEAQFKANADILAARLKPYGYDTAVVDIRWTVQNEGFKGYNQKNPVYTLDEYGRYLPAPNRFPSSADGKGFKPLADWCHAKGLKFGIHIMRGVPKEAVARKCPVLGAGGVTCDQIGNNKVECNWLRDNCTVEQGRPGAQEYYDSIFTLYAAWGVDFVKVDDLSAPTYRQAEVEMIRRAIDRTDRAIVFSTSPGETPLAAGGHLRAHANMWRMVNDVWDTWGHIAHLVPIACDWLKEPHCAGSWPDCDMIPLGKLGVAGHYWSEKGGAGRDCRLTPAEQQTLMHLFAICRSPLFIGADLPQLDDATFALLTDPLTLAAQRDGRDPSALFCDPSACAIASDAPDGGKFLALFNLKDEESEVSALGVTRRLPPHGSALLRL